MNMMDSENGVPAGSAAPPSSREVSPEAVSSSSFDGAIAPNSSPLVPDSASAPPLSPESPIADVAGPAVVPPTPSAPPLSPDESIAMASAPPLSPEQPTAVPSAPPMSLRRSKSTRSSNRRQLKVYDVVSISIERGIDEFIRTVNTRLATRRYRPVGGITIDKDKNVYLQALTTIAQENKTRRSLQK